MLAQMQGAQCSVVWVACRACSSGHVVLLWRLGDVGEQGMMLYRLTAHRDGPGGPELKLDLVLVEQLILVALVQL
jgi:hypothetical protein